MPIACRRSRAALSLVALVALGSLLLRASTSVPAVLSTPPTSQQPLETRSESPRPVPNNDLPSSVPTITINFNDVSRCPAAKDVVLVGNRPVGTYLCSYFPLATVTRTGCEIKCPLTTCRVFHKATPEQLQTAQIVVNHHGPVPKRHTAAQMTVFYSGESNISEGKKSRPEYLAQYSHVVTFHTWRPHHFTWTHRHLADFTLVAKTGRLRAPGDAPWRERRFAAVSFISRCGKGGRDVILKKLHSGGVTVHSFGKCVQNRWIDKEFPQCVAPGNRYLEKLCVMSKYKFVVALENTQEEDYVTEKVYHGLFSGAVPLYDGAPNVVDFLPSGDAIVPLQNFSSSPVALRSGDVDVGLLLAALKRIDGDPAPLFAWQRNSSSWNARFLGHLRHVEPTCALCDQAALSRCAT